METIGFYFGSQISQTDPVEGRKRLHGFVVLIVNKEEISEKEIGKRVVAQLVLALPFPNHFLSLTSPSNNFNFFFF